ncbi:MAG TPA: hypothetical protein PK986_04975 [Spirochaetota bacterium]|nr:hypothetical protein [Spirochaetota bacterium]HQO39803.1 hypothetical protein [Spirochaetota bacterium]
MKKRLLTLFIILFSAFFYINSSSAVSDVEVVNTIRLAETDIPEGYRYGIIPDFAAGLLKSNPWMLDPAAKKKLAHRIYPGAEYTRISSLHMTILATDTNPYGDDIVCYIFMFNDEKSAKDEIIKLNEYCGYNSDRSIVLEKNNIAVFLLVDSTKDYPHIRTISESMRNKLDSI